MLKKVAIIVLAGLSLTFTTVYADDDGSMETVYHVYMDGKHIGKVDNKNLVTDFIDKKVTSKASDFEDLSLDVDETITFVTERVFDPAYNNNEVTNILKEELSVKAEAVEFQIGDETVGYFKDQNTADNVLNVYKEKFVDKKVLEKLANKQQNQGETALSVGESIITDVKLSKKVSFSEEKTSPADIMSVKEGLKMLEKGTLEEKVHKVKKGEVLGTIADTYDLSVKKLLKLNENLDENSTLQIGDEIHVTELKPFVDVIVNEEKMKKESLDYETKIVESDDLYKGDKKIKQDGQDGKKKVHYKFKLKNGNVINQEIVNEETIKEPVKKIIIKGTKVVPSRGTGQLQWPAVGGYVSSNVGMRWGSMHKGMDIAGPSNRTILAADNGTVVSAGWDSGGYGNKIIISHNNGMKTVYAHLSSISVSPGQTVEKGSKIGVMGTTGNSTGIHLHFELYKNGALQNPQKYL